MDRTAGQRGEGVGARGSASGFVDDVNEFGGVCEGVGLPAGFFYLGEEGGGVVLGHALFAAGERVVGEGDDEDRGVDLVEEALGGARLDLFEAGEGFEEEGDVG